MDAELRFRLTVVVLGALPLVLLIAGFLFEVTGH